MFELVPFKAEHVFPLLQEQINKGDDFLAGVAVGLESTDAVTLLLNGEVIMCGGITQYWPGRGQVWSVFSAVSKRNFVGVFRAMKKWLDEKLKTKYHRIELSVDIAFFQGRRRAEMLGFHCEIEVAKKYLPTGEDCSLFAMVRE